jgi:hypothetical protein
VIRRPSRAAMQYQEVREDRDGAQLAARSGLFPKKDREDQKGTIGTLLTENEIKSIYFPFLLTIVGRLLFGLLVPERLPAGKTKKTKKTELPDDSSRASRNSSCMKARGFISRYRARGAPPQPRRAASPLSPLATPRGGQVTTSPETTRNPSGPFFFNRKGGRIRNFCAKTGRGGFAATSSTHQTLVSRRRPQHE